MYISIEFETKDISECGIDVNDIIRHHDKILTQDDYIVEDDDMLPDLQTVYTMIFNNSIFYVVTDGFNNVIRLLNLSKKIEYIV